jgi:hypothetical protein
MIRNVAILYEKLRIRSKSTSQLMLQSSRPQHVKWKREILELPRDSFGLDKISEALT